MTEAQLAMDLASAMDVGDGVGVNVGLNLNVHNPLDTIDNQIPLTDVEDLFGDPLSMQQMQQLQGPTVSKRLLQRLDELRSRGCCQYVLSTPVSICPRSSTT
jgi:mediator of RNA polymerase II transcription subunit 16